MHRDLIKFVSKKDLQNIRGALRQAFIRSNYKGEFIRSQRIERPVLKKNGEIAKRPRVTYKCVKCLNEFKVDQINVDHIRAVGSFESIEEFYEFFLRIFCAHENLQILCKDCHKRKTRFDRLKF